MENMREEHLSKAYFVRSMLSKISDNADLIDQKKHFLKEETEKKFAIKKPEMLAELKRENTYNVSDVFPEYLATHSDEDIVVEYKNNIAQLSKAQSRAERVEQQQNEIKKLRRDKQDEIDGLRGQPMGIFILDLFSLAVFLLILAFAKGFFFKLFFLFAVTFLNFYLIRKTNNKKKKILAEIKVLDQKFSVVKQSQTDDSHMQEELSKIRSRNDEIKRIISRRIYDEMEEELRKEKILKIEALKNKVALWETQKDDFEKNQKKNVKTLEQEICNIGSNTKEIYNILRRDFKMFIDERDWKYLDLIIYELETGRAESIKEALQQADLYVRHNEMKEIMQTATVAICSSIKESMGDISRSIRTQITGLRSDITELNQTQRDLSGKLDDMVDAQELSNALLKKANVSSEKLAEDVSRIRRLHDYDHSSEPF